MKSPCQTIIKQQLLNGVTGIRSLPAKAKPYFLFGAFEDNTYLWIVPNSHKASFNPRNHQLRKTMLVKLMKGDIIVCNALLLHAGYGYGTICNIRYHMCLWNRQLHLKCLYEVDCVCPIPQDTSRPLHFPTVSLITRLGSSSKNSI